MRSWKLLTTLSMAVALCAVVGVGLTLADDDKAKADKPAFPQCAVMDDPVDFSVNTMTKDGPVYFCCAKCIEKYKGSPEKYAKRVAMQRKAVAALPKVQVSCPISGEPLDPKSYIEKDGKRISFCCERCIAKYKKSPEKFAAKLAASYTYQTKCPVSGEAIDPSASMKTTDGKSVYFCCDKCKAKFMKEPAKYSDKLESQGTIIDPDKVKAEKKDDHAGHGHD
jgi:YHS domain-containing protein